MCGYRRGMDWWMYLLTTYTHDSERKAITAPPLISTFHKSPQHPLSLFHALRSSLRRLLYRTDLVAPVVFLNTPRHGPRRNTQLPTVSPLLRVDSLLRERFYRVVAQKRPSYIPPSRGRCIATDVYATLLSCSIFYCTEERTPGLPCDVSTSVPFIAFTDGVPEWSSNITLYLRFLSYFVHCCSSPCVH
jgi:hypothetical protein